MANINGNLSVVGEVLNLKLEKLAADPTGGGLVESRVWYNTVTKALKLYNGTAAVELGGGISAEDLADALVPYAQTTDVNTAISNAVQDLVSGTEMQGAIDNALAGLDFQSDVLGVEGVFTNAAGRYIYEDGSAFTSGVAAAAGDIVVVDAAGVIQSVAYDVSVAGPGALTWNRDTSTWYRWNGTNWAEFGGLSGFTAGNGLESAGDVVSVKAANASIVVAAGGISVGDLSATYVTQAEKADLATDAELAAVASDVSDLQTQVSASFFAFDSDATSATSHTVTHNLNYRWPIVQVVDKTTNTTVIPDSITFNSVNELVITLGVAATVLVQVSWVKTTA
uniref:Virion structural protein n=1 Tax=Pseudomonas phage HRDY3 TaxID=3236930 RepID=A0AB39CDW2_9VIRU